MKRWAGLLLAVGLAAGAYGVLLRFVKAGPAAWVVLPVVAGAVMGHAWGARWLVQGVVALIILVLSLCVLVALRMSGAYCGC